jgi:hypothetical protein
MRRFDDREMAAVLAGLRLYQRFRNSLYGTGRRAARLENRAGLVSGFSRLTNHSPWTNPIRLLTATSYTPA